MMYLVILHRVEQKPAIIRTHGNRTKDGVRHQDMTMIVELAGCAAPMKEITADLTARGISDMVSATAGTINPPEEALPATTMCLVIPRRVEQRPAIIRILSNRTRDGVRHQDMTMIVELAGCVAPMKEIIADLTVRGISDMVSATAGTINPPGEAFPATMMCLVIPRHVEQKPAIIRIESK
jgi:hypothetical protein